MKQAAMLILLLGMFSGVASASDPCCAVISVNAGKAQALVRNNKTGRTFLLKGTNFRAGASLSGLPNDLFEPFWSEPCCSVASIQTVGPGALVSATNKTTGKTVWFEVSGAESPIQAMKIGQAVNVVGNWAVLSVSSAALRSGSSAPALQVRTLSGAPSTQAFYSFQLK